MSKLTQAVLVGGIAAGVVSAVAPRLSSFFGILCCAFIVGGAMVSVFLAFRDPDLAEKRLANGAVIGLLSGLVAAVIGTVVSLALDQILGNPEAEQLQQMIDSGELALEGPLADLVLALAGGGPGMLLSLVISLVGYSILGALGGVLGGAMFGRNN